MIEKKIDELIAALEANTAALQGAAPAAKAAKPAAKKATGTKKPAPTPEPDAPAADSVVAPDRKTLQDTFIAVAQEKGRDVAVGALAEYGAQTLPELLKQDKAVWAEFYGKLQALQAGE